MGEFAVSPDGSRVAYANTYYDIEQNKGNAELYLIPVEGDGQAVRITNTVENEFNPVWLNDKTLLFARGNTIVSMNVDAKKETVLATIDAGLEGFKISPKGDKILYINPTTGTQIKPIAYTLDKTGYMYDGKPLGDHYPVAATFQVVSKGSGIDNVTSLIENEQMITDKTVYNLKGQRTSQPQGGIYIERQGETVSKRIIK